MLREGDDRHELERTSLFRIAFGKGAEQGRKDKPSIGR